MLEQLSEQMDKRRVAMGVSFYQLEKDLKISIPTIHRVFQKGKGKGKNYSVKHLLDIAAYLGIGLLTFDNTKIKVEIEKSLTPLEKIKNENTD